MFRISLPFTDWSLRLAPRWGESSSPWQITGLALLAIVPLMLILWLYRYEMRLVRRRTAALLLGLRVLVILLLWSVVGLQPTLARFTTVEVPGRVLIAVDRSASIGVPDPQRTKLEKLRLARALNLKIDGTLPTPTQLDAWIGHYQAKGEASEPAWVAPDEAPADSGQHRRLVEERRALHDKVCAAIDKLTRAEIVRRLLSDDGAGLLKAITAKHTVEVTGFDRKVWEMKGAQLSEFLKGKATDRADAAFTDLCQPLLHARERSGSQQGRTLGLILLTDGRHNGKDAPLDKVGKQDQTTLPILVVPLGSRKPPPDIALTAVTAPANVPKGLDAAVEARFKVSGLPAQEIVVELHQGKEPPSEEHVKRIKHDGTDRFYTVPFQVRMDTAGNQQLEVKVRPTLKGTKEITEENNSQSAIVRVGKDRAKVLLIDGEARWEYHYLASALRRDRNVEPDTVVFVQPRVGRLSEADLEKLGNPRLHLPKQEEGKEAVDPLLKYDCVILGDVQPEQLPLEDRKRLEAYVANRGGTLVILAGKRYMPLAFHSAASDDEDDPLLRMLPIEKPRAVSPGTGFPVTLTHDGGLTPFLQMDTTAEESAQRWAEFPRHYWGLVGRRKPGAVTLAYLADDLRSKDDIASDKKDKDALEKAQGLIVRQNYGFGRVLLVGLDSTWRWRYRTGDAYHHRFWGQVVRWAAADKLLPAGNRYVRFGSRDPVYRQGQDASITVRLEDEVPLLPAGAIAAARIFRLTADGKEEPAALVPLGRNDRQPRLLDGEVPNLLPGQYRIELHIPALADKIKEPPEEMDAEADKQRRDVFTVLPADGGEMVELATNWPLLEKLAADSKGQVIAPEDVGRLADLLVRQVELRERRDEQKLWEDMPLVWVTLGVFLFLLTVEWVGRKLAGLP
ncbi:MAG TPA: hypothetical protein VEL76_33725 [Gemmataceae bacterium]|nr:hypothetical protein [Gemmataceae bacterium]